MTCSWLEYKCGQFSCNKTGTQSRDFSWISVFDVFWCWGHNRIEIILHIWPLLQSHYDHFFLNFQSLLLIFFILCYVFSLFLFIYIFLHTIKTKKCKTWPFSVVITKTDILKRLWNVCNLQRREMTISAHCLLAKIVFLWFQTAEISGFFLHNQNAPVSVVLLLQTHIDLLNPLKKRWVYGVFHLVRADRRTLKPSCQNSSEMSEHGQGDIWRWPLFYPWFPLHRTLGQVGWYPGRWRSVGPNVNILATPLHMSFTTG